MGDRTRHLLRYRDRIFSQEFVNQLKTMGIKEVLSAPRSPGKGVCGTSHRLASPRMSQSSDCAQ